MLQHLEPCQSRLPSERRFTKLAVAYVSLFLKQPNKAGNLSGPGKSLSRPGGSTSVALVPERFVVTTLLGKLYHYSKVDSTTQHDTGL